MSWSMVIQNIRAADIAFMSLHRRVFDWNTSTEWCTLSKESVIDKVGAAFGAVSSENRVTSLGNLAGLSIILSMLSWRRVD